MIVSTVRPIRNAVSLIREDAQDLVCSSGFAVLESKKVEPEYLFVYLKSKPIIELLDRLTTATMYPAITIDDVLNTKIYLGNENFRQEIKDKVIKAQMELQQSRFFYSQAEVMLLEELDLQDFKPEENLSYVVNLSDIKSVHRMDADYFQPKYEKIFHKIKVPIETLDQLTQFLNHSKQPPYVDDGDIPIVTQRHLGQAFLNLAKFDGEEIKYTNMAWLQNNQKYKLRQGDVLYYSVGAYIGKTNIIFDEIKATAASFITIIRPKQEKLNPIYLTVVLNSIIGKLQSEKWQSATAQQYIYPKDISNFKIPILPKPTQQKISDLGRKSYEARKKAKDLLEEAKQKVERIIKEGGIDGLGNEESVKPVD